MFVNAHTRAHTILTTYSCVVFLYAEVNENREYIVVTWYLSAFAVQKRSKLWRRSYVLLTVHTSFYYTLYCLRHGNGVKSVNYIEIDFGFCFSLLVFFSFNHFIVKKKHFLKINCSFDSEIIHFELILFQLQVFIGLIFIL